MKFTYFQFTLCNRFKPSLLLMVLITSMNIAMVYAAVNEDVMIPAKALQGECKLITGDYGHSIQARALFTEDEKTSILYPYPEEKTCQSIQCGKKKATIYYYQYQNISDALKSLDGIKTFIWGEDQPSWHHPELIFAKDNIVIVVSSSKPKPFEKLLLDYWQSQELKRSAISSSDRVEAFILPSGKELRFRIPSQFSFSSSYKEVPGSPTITIAAPNKEILLMITFGAQPKEDKWNSKDKLEREITRIFKDYVKGSVEKSLQISWFEGSSMFGCYTIFTDAALAGKQELPADEYLNSTTGFMAWQDHFAFFTLLSNSTDSQYYKLAREILLAGISESRLQK